MHRIPTEATLVRRPESRHGLYPRLLGADWERLDPAVRRAHADGVVLRAVGVFRVRHGAGRLRRIVLRAAGVPAPSDAARVDVSISRHGPFERWRRGFGGRPFVTVQREGAGGLLAERLGTLEFRFRLTVERGALLYRQTSLAVCLGPLRLPVPGRLAPRVVAREGPVGGTDRTSVDVVVTTPAGGLLFSYQGSVHWGALPR